MERKKEQAKVLSQEMLADGIYSLWIETEAALTARPGQFVSVYTTDASKLLPRPISICEIDKEAKRLRLVYRVTGEKTGTKQFSELKAGDFVPVIGPLGNGFPYEKAEGKKVFLMGGGIGVPPLLELAIQLKNLPKVKAFVFDSEDGDPFTVFEGYTTNILKLIGVENVMSGQNVDKTWAKTSWESFVKADPDYIIIVDYSTSDRTEDDFAMKVDKMKNNPQLASVKAIKENHFIRVKLSEITPGVRTVDALERLAKEMHPDMK